MKFYLLLASILAAQITAAPVSDRTHRDLLFAETPMPQRMTYSSAFTLTAFDNVLTTTQPSTPLTTPSDEEVWAAPVPKFDIISSEVHTTPTPD